MFHPNINRLCYALNHTHARQSSDAEINQGLLARHVLYAVNASRLVLSLTWIVFSVLAHSYLPHRLDSARV